MRPQVADEIEEREMKLRSEKEVPDIQSYVRRIKRWNANGSREWQDVQYKIEALLEMFLEQKEQIDDMQERLAAIVQFEGEEEEDDT
jgi:hypothetical protein